jgi:hypothetical protein
MAKAVGRQPVIAEFDPKPVHVNVWWTSGTGNGFFFPSELGFYNIEYHSASTPYSSSSEALWKENRMRTFQREMPFQKSGTLDRKVE